MSDWWCQKQKASGSDCFAVVCRLFQTQRYFVVCLPLPVFSETGDGIFYLRKWKEQFQADVLLHCVLRIYKEQKRSRCAQIKNAQSTGESRENIPPWEGEDRIAGRERGRHGKDERERCSSGS